MWWKFIAAQANLNGAITCAGAAKTYTQGRIAALGHPGLPFGLLWMVRRARKRLHWQASGKAPQPQAGNRHEYLHRADVAPRSVGLNYG